MKYLIRLTLALALSASMPAANGADVTFSLSDFITGPIANKTVQIQPIGGAFTFGNAIISSDRLSFKSSASGGLVVSNMVPGLYRVDINGAYDKSTFSILVPTNATMDAHDLVAKMTNVMGLAIWYVDSGVVTNGLAAIGYVNSQVAASTNGASGVARIAYVDAAILTNGTALSNFVLSMISTNADAGSRSGNFTNVTIWGATGGTNIGYPLIIRANPEAGGAVSSLLVEGTNGYPVAAVSYGGIFSGSAAGMSNFPGAKLSGVVPGSKVATNSDSSAGVVTAGGGHNNQVWGTDGAGVPGWRPGVAQGVTWVADSDGYIPDADDSMIVLGDGSVALLPPASWYPGKVYAFKYLGPSLAWVQGPEGIDGGLVAAGTYELTAGQALALQSDGATNWNIVAMAGIAEGGGGGSVSNYITYVTNISYLTNITQVTNDYSLTNVYATTNSYFLTNTFATVVRVTNIYTLTNLDFDTVGASWLVLTNPLQAAFGGSGRATLDSGKLLAGDGTNAVALVSVGSGLSLAGGTLSATGTGTGGTNVVGSTNEVRVAPWIGSNVMVCVSNNANIIIELTNNAGLVFTNLTPGASGRIALYQDGQSNAVHSIFSYAGATVVTNWQGLAIGTNANWQGLWGYAVIATNAVYVWDQEPPAGSVGSSAFTTVGVEAGYSPTTNDHWLMVHDTSQITLPLASSVPAGTWFRLTFAGQGIAGMDGYATISPTEGDLLDTQVTPLLLYPQEEVIIERTSAEDWTSGYNSSTNELATTNYVMGVVAPKLDATNGTAVGLTVQNLTNAPGGSISFGTNGTYIIAIGTNTVITNAAGLNVIVTPGGNVGIGKIPGYALDAMGVINASSSIAAGASLAAGGASSIAWAGRSKIYSPSDGVIYMMNAAGTGFAGLGLGTNNPQAAAHVRGSVIIETNLTIGQVLEMKPMATGPTGFTNFVFWNSNNAGVYIRFTNGTDKALYP